MAKQRPEMSRSRLGKASAPISQAQESADFLPLPWCEDEGCLVSLLPSGRPMMAPTRPQAVHPAGSEGSHPPPAPGACLPAWSPPEVNHQPSERLSSSSQGTFCFFGWGGGSEGASHLLWSVPESSLRAPLLPCQLLPGLALLNGGRIAQQCLQSFLFPAGRADPRKTRCSPE